MLTAWAFRVCLSLSGVREATYTEKPQVPVQAPNSSRQPRVYFLGPSLVRLGAPIMEPHLWGWGPAC